MPGPTKKPPVTPEMVAALLPSTTEGLIGRPSKMTPEILLKIEQVAALDGSIEEMAYYAGIYKGTLYRWLQEDEELRDRIQQLRERPVLVARQTINKALVHPDYAFRYLERKRAKEFMPTAKIQHEGQVAIVPGEVTPEQEAIKDKFEAELRATLAQPIKPITAPETPVEPSSGDGQSPKLQE